MDKIKPISDELKTLYNQSSVTDCSQQLTKLKICLTQLGRSQSELIAARDALELACMVVVKSGDDHSFERLFAQLRPFYFDFGLSSSPQQSIILGLYLLFLLTRGRIGDFHTELELFPGAHDDSFIKFAIELEQDMNEGRYNRVWQACKSTPHPSYTHFAVKLTDAARLDIAKCLESSCKRLAISDAMNLLRFSPQEEQQFKNFVQDEERGWSINDGYVCFHCIDDSASLDIGATTLIHQSLSYAHEIERII